MIHRIFNRRQWPRARFALAAAVLLVLGGEGAALIAAGLGTPRQPPAMPLPAATGTPGAAASPSPARSSARARSAPGTPAAAAAAGRDAQPAWQPGLAAGHLSIPVFRVTASVVPGTMTSAGELDPPRAPQVVSTWPGSAGLDAGAGEVTIAGHVNWAGMGPFAFGDLAYLLPGDLIYTAGASGGQTAWRVTQVFALGKGQPVDAAAFAGPAGPRRLALITCGGQYDPATGSYADNVYVLASAVWQG